MAPAKQKIIQKKMRYRERFCLMARKKHRKLKGLFEAKAEILPQIEKSIGNYTLVYQYSPGIIFGESDGGINTEPSMLNKGHITNSAKVIKERDHKLVHFKFAKRSCKGANSSQEEIDRWEKSGQVGWAELAKKLRTFSICYNNFLEKHREKFTTGNVDKESVKRYKAYQIMRKELMATKCCVEIKVSFNSEEDFFTEMVCNSIALANIGYDVNEFVDKALREGVPRIIYSENDNGLIMRTIMENFENSFEKTIEIATPRELRFMGKDQIMKTGKEVALMTGYFLNNKAELSYLLIYDDIKPLPDGEIFLRSLRIPIIKEDISDYFERKAFLEKYYNNRSKYLHCGTVKTKIMIQNQLEAKTRMIRDESYEKNFDEEYESFSTVQFDGEDSQSISISSEMIIPLYNEIMNNFNGIDSITNSNDSNSDWSIFLC